MIFKEAFELMKQGAKVKLPGWNGYEDVYGKITNTCHTEE